MKPLFLTEMQTRAESTFHSTASEAARFADPHQVYQLILGHYSSRYFDMTPFLEEAQPIFSETMLAIEGQTYEVQFQPYDQQYTTNATNIAAR